MPTYYLKDKIKANKDFLNELEKKSWAEIENLQNQINNIEASEESKTLIQLIKNLLTSYYVFVGGLENLNSESSSVSISKPEFKELETVLELPEENLEVQDVDTINTSDYEPFEYFVDFDEPIGKPLSDEDLYG